MFQAYNISQCFLCKCLVNIPELDQNSPDAANRFGRFQPPAVISWHVYRVLSSFYESHKDLWRTSFTMQLYAIPSIQCRLTIHYPMTPCGTPGYSSYNVAFFDRIPYSHKYYLHQALCSSMLSPQFNAGLPSIIPGHLVAPQATPATIHHSFIESHTAINTTYIRLNVALCSPLNSMQAYHPLSRDTLWHPRLLQPQFIILL